MAKIGEKLLARKLRTQGESIKAIAKKLSVSQSTVSVWCRDVELGTRAKRKLLSNTKARNAAGLLAYSNKRRAERKDQTERNVTAGKRLLGKLSERDVFCIGLGLYWGEGYKKGNREFGFTNSDPDMILFYIHWLQTVFGVQLSDLTLRVSINQQHGDRINAVERYWSSLTGVALEQFTKPSLIKVSSRKIYSQNTDHFGTLRIKVRNGSDFREQVLGAISAAAKR